MADMTITEFCDRHEACREGREWAMANCQSMREVWDTAKPEWLLWVACCRGVLSARDLRLFAVRCARSVEHLMKDPLARDAIAVAERFALGTSTAKDLDLAQATAWKTACGAEIAAARSASRHAADAAEGAADAAGRAAAWAAHYAVAAAERDAALDATWAASREQQSAWLRELVPCFSGGEWVEVACE